MTCVRVLAQPVLLAALLLVAAHVCAVRAADETLEPLADPTTHQLVIGFASCLRHHLPQERMWAAVSRLSPQIFTFVGAR